MEKLTILFEDENIVVINKPSGMLSVSYPGSTGKTAQSVLEEILRKKGTVNSYRKPFAVHRLDRDTSGVMMFALNEKIQKQIMDDWQNMVTERKYIAVAENPKKMPHSVARRLAHGATSKTFFKPLADEGEIALPLAYNARNQGYVPAKDENVETVDARTSYKILIRGATHSLFELELDTGRKNQIRAHLAHFGYPLAGDENYKAKTNPFGRLALHAKTLEFTHPVTEKKMRFEIDEPKEWKEFVKKDSSTSLGMTNRSLGMTKGEREMTKGSQGTQKGKKKTSRNKEPIPEFIKRTTRKEEAHLDFIALGKRRQK